MRVVIFVLVAMLFSGCVIKREPVDLMVLDLPKPVDMALEGSCGKTSLKISNAFVAAPLVSLKMSYRKDGADVRTFNRHRWLDMPSNTLTQELLLYTRQSGIFESVFSAKSRSKSEFILEVSLDEFMHYFEGGESFVRVEYALSLIDAKQNRVLSSKSFGSKVVAKTPDAIGGVGAYSEAIGNLLQESVEWLARECR
ncbi:MAG: ABC-type transport auxiliary lipoprotein family protein [Sulfuricurvum sp.]